MIDYIEQNPSAFDEAVELALGDEQPLSWRAAWLLWGCMEENDPRVQKYIGRIIDALPGKRDGHQRELLKILCKMELDDEYEGVVFDISMNLWEQTNKTPSVRHNAIKFIMKMAKKYPDIAGEIDFLTQNHYMESLSPGVRRSVLKMVNHLPE